MIARTTTARAARGLAAGVALLALAAPAEARPLLQDAPYSGAPATSFVTPADVHDPLGAGATASAPHVVIVHGTGFDWTDAGVGAAATGGLVVLLGAGLIVTTRGRRRGQAAQTAH